MRIFVVAHTILLDLDSFSRIPKNVIQRYGPTNGWAIFCYSKKQQFEFASTIFELFTDDGTVWRISCVSTYVYNSFSYSSMYNELEPNPIFTNNLLIPAYDE